MTKSSFASLAKPFVLGACLAVAATTTIVLTAQAQSPDQDPDQRAAGFADHLRPRIQQAGAPQSWTLEERMAHYAVPGVAVAVIDDGAVVYEAGFGVLQAGGDTPVDAHTVFSAGSVSKVVTATLILRLADTGYLDLDADVLDTVSSWQLPADRDAFAGEPVNLRAILSHTSGFNIHGFADFQPGEALPDVIATLNGAAPASGEPLAREFRTGSGYQYSGGGYTLAQLLVSDVMGAPFETVARDQLFAPLGLTRSTYTNPLPPEHGNIARAHNGGGEPVALPRGYEAMPEMAASGLWTSAHDLGALVAGLIDSYRGEAGPLSQSGAIAMMTRVAPGEHGLGPRVTGSGERFVFHHGGTNNSYRAWIEGHPATGDGLVILTNGARGRSLIDEIRNAVADTMGWPVNAPVVAPELSLDPAVLADFSGTYAVDAGFPVDLREQMSGGFFELPLAVRVQDGQLEIGRAGGDRYSPLTPLSPTRFVLADMADTMGIWEIEFHRNALGEATGLTLRLENALSHYRRQD